MPLRLPRSFVSALSLMLLGVFSVPAAVPASTLAQSSFSANTEGWTNVMLPYPSAIPATVLGTYTPAWFSGLGGYIRLNDPDGSGSTGDAQYWSAPASYLGSQSAAYGGELSLDLADSGSGFGSFFQEDILLIGGGLTLVRTLPSTPGGAFVHYALAMTETGWKRGGLLGPDATEAEFRSVLAFIDHLYIRAEYQLGPDIQFLDEVRLTSGTLETPAATLATSFSLSAPSPNPSLASTRVNLSLPHAAEGDVEVYDTSGRRVAIIGAGAWPAGVHALEWNGANQNGTRVRAGLYWVIATIQGQRIAQRIVRIE